MGQTYLELTQQLFDEALDAGTIQVSGETEDGRVLFTRTSE